jgi:UDP-glucose 4-epimerase
VQILFGCDVADPVSALEEMDFVHADTRHAVIGKLIRQLRIDTVVHMAVTVDSAREGRAAHETNVIGTMNVLVGCTGPSSPVAPDRQVEPSHLRRRRDRPLVRIRGDGEH